MTPASKRLFILFAFLFACFIQTGWAQYSPTNEIISNDIYLLEGSGDTLWMLTSKGVNYTTSIIGNPLAWSGFKGVSGFNMSFANGSALAFLWTGSPQNEIWRYYHQTAQYSIIPLLYKTTQFDEIPNLEEHFAFYAVDAAWFNNTFWIACMDGGLAKLDPSDSIKTIFYPGKNKKAYNFDTFIPDSLSINSPDPAARIMAVASDDSLLWMVCEKALWSFNPGDTTWSRINDSTLSFSEYVDIELRLIADTSLIVTITSNINTDTTYSLHTYNSITGQWIKLIEESYKDLPSIELGAKGYLYVIDPSNNEITLYQQTSIDSAAVELGYDFSSRMTNAGDEIVNSSFNDIHYAIHNSDTLLQIATDIGLLYSTNEHFDEINNVPFQYVSRKIPLASDLGKTYAVPGIINNNYPEAYFAYNLSKDDDVTIDIFDYNMDHVVRIIDNAPRLAGKHRTSGRSTVRTYDRWDGTINGRPVPPGVYFYRIKTEKGKRAFGKVIVARN